MSSDYYSNKDLKEELEKDLKKSGKGCKACFSYFPTVKNSGYCSHHYGQMNGGASDCAYIEGRDYPKK